MCDTFKNKTLYEILDVDKCASSDDIKKAYRKKALRWHPDRNNGDKEAETMFKEISKAYQILSDVDKKRTYDLTGSTDGIGTTFDFSSSMDIFNEIFKSQVI